MSNKLCRQAIETALSAWADSQSLPVAWENVPFTQTATTYLRAFLLPAKTVGIDLSGVGREYSGVYQVSIVAPIETGPGAAEGIVDGLAALFPLDSLLSVTGLTLQIVTPVTAAHGATDANRYTVPVSFTYRAYTI